MEGNLSKSDIEIILNSRKEFNKNYKGILENGNDYLIEFKKNISQTLSAKETRDKKEHHLYCNYEVFAKYNSSTNLYDLYGDATGYTWTLFKKHKGLDFNSQACTLNNVSINEVGETSIMIAFEVHKIHNIDYDLQSSIQIDSINIASDKDKRKYYYNFKATPPPAEKIPEIKTTKTYFITDGEYVKIGITEDIEKRLSGIQTGNPKKIKLIHYIEGNKEYEYHRKFKKYRANGEWFIFNKEIKDFIEKLKESFPDTRSGNLELDFG